MGEITRIKTANHEEWLDLRRKYIGGSDAAIVVGMNPFASLYSLWAEKTGRVPGFAGNLATEVGTYLEEFVAKKFEQETGKKVRRCNQSILNSDYPWAIANIDREIVGEDAGLEIKTTDSLNLKKFKGGDYPANYYCQMMHYLAVTGKKKWYLAVLIGNREFKTFELERDEEEIHALMESEKAFWTLVEKDTPPSADGSEATGRTLNALHPDANGKSVVIGQFEMDLRRRDALKQQVDELTGQVNEIENRIKAYMGENERGEGVGYKVSWANQQRRTFDQKRFEKDYKSIDLSGYYKVSNYRVFRVNQK